MYIEFSQLHFCEQLTSGGLASSSLAQVSESCRYNRTQGTAAEFIFDGKTITLNGKNANAYLQVNGPKTIDEATRALGFETGLDMPSVEFLDADPYAGLVSSVQSSDYLGTVHVNGVECHYLTFRAAQVDWQLWVATGEKPLPMKYIITSKWVTAASQYAIRFRDWDTDPVIKSDQFSFLAPKGVSRLDSIPVNALGEIMIGRASDEDCSHYSNHCRRLYHAHNRTCD